MKIAIVHYGEDIPTDPGYRPLRYGRFARQWTESGDQVVRIAPAFSHLRRARREPGSTRSGEGEAIVLRTTTYRSARSLRRAAFLSQFIVRAALELRRQRPDVALVGYPPPGVITLSRLFGVRCPVVVDVRDIWFDHRLSAPNPVVAISVRTMSWLARRELAFADGVVALSENVSAWIGLRDVLIAPIGVDESHRPFARRNSGPLRALFIGSVNERFDLERVVESWPQDAGAATLRIVGDGPALATLQRVAAGNRNVDLSGPLASSEVPAVIRECDVGLVPTVAGFGTVFSNKVAEYLAGGLFIVHSLEAEPASLLASSGLGVRCHDGSWGDTVSALDPASLDAGRAERRARAIDRHGARVVGAELRRFLGQLGPESAVRAGRRIAKPEASGR